MPAFCQIQARRTHHQRFHTPRGRFCVRRAAGAERVHGSGSTTQRVCVRRQAGGALLFSRHRARETYSGRMVAAQGPSELGGMRTAHCSSAGAAPETPIAVHCSSAGAALKTPTAGSWQRRKDPTSLAAGGRRIVLQPSAGDAPETHIAAHCSPTWGRARPESAGSPSSEGQRPRSQTNIRIASENACVFLRSVVLYSFSVSV